MKISSISYINKVKFPSKNQNNCVFRGSEKVDSFELSDKKSIDKILLTHQKPVKILFSDFDRTIRDTEQKCVPPRTVSSILDLQRENIPFVLATGRCVPELDFIKEDFPIKPQFFILGHGSQILDENENSLFLETLDNEISKEIINFYLKNKKKYPELLMALKSPEKVEIFDGSRPSPTPKDLNLILFGCINAMIYPKIYNLQADLVKEFGTCDLNIEVSSPRSCEVMRKSTTKFNAAKKVADMLNIKLENAAALGDANNDLSIIENIQKLGGLGIAMGNSSEDLLKRANYVTGHISNDGFGNAIRIILQNNKRLNECKKH